MTAPEDQKAAQCPLCSSKAELALPPFGGAKPKARCSNIKCELFCVLIDLAQWNTRPREKELEVALVGAKALLERNDAVLMEISRIFDDYGHPVSSEFAATKASEIEEFISAINAALEEKR